MKVDSGVMRLMEVELDAIARVFGIAVGGRKGVKRQHGCCHKSWRDNVASMRAWIDMLRAAKL